MPPKNKLQRITLPSSSYLLKNKIPLVPNNDFFSFFFFLWQNICHFAIRKKLPSNLHSQGNFWKKNSKRNQSSRESYLIAKKILGGFGHIIAI
jgi:hypothetical protein